MHLDPPTEDLLRREAPQVLGALVRRYGRFDVAEDAVQEALLAAARQWPVDGVPEKPRGWLIRVASRAMTDMLHSQLARQRREEQLHVAIPPDRFLAPAADAVRQPEDDSLLLLFLCCHPSLSAASQVALTLRAVGGLTTEEIARGFLVPAATMGQRISRAKATVAKSGAAFRMPAGSEVEARLRAVLRVIYLIFNEGYVATAGEELTRVDLSGEAIRLARLLRHALPDDGEVAGLTALLLLTEARRPARVAADGTAVPIAEQDRERWDRRLIEEGTALLDSSMGRTRLGPYQIQAAIAALHDAAARPADTDWPQILALYTLLQRYDDSPMVTLNRAVAVAMVQGPRAGLDQLRDLDGLGNHHRLHAVRAHLLDLAGDQVAARSAYRQAARLTLSMPERRHLLHRADRLGNEP
ncbi:RNA polymerase sigma factor [Micromonospora sp. NPDC003197]